MLYHLSAQDLGELDRWEAYPSKYDRVALPVLDRDGNRHSALTYLLRDFFPNPPSDEYLGIIRQAYNRFGFPGESLQQALNGGGDDPATGH